MLDSVTKRRIDTARDILVGKVPDPKSQVEQITIALIYKFMDDMDAQAEELGGKRKFFTGQFARYGWGKLMAPGVSGEERIALYAEGMIKMPQNPSVPPLFRNIFKNAFLPYRDPETLKAFLKTINDFEYDHSERLGDAFEYLLSVLGSQGQAGQFRTPRHIIDFIVAIVDPKKNETVLDPACGTAGFLISAYKHILRANSTPAAIAKNGGNGEAEATLHTSKIPLAKGDLLTPDERKKLADNFRGYDISPDMVRLSLVNMYLHGFTDPHVYEYDTLTSQDRWNEMADVILANPPFMSPKGGIKPHNRFSVQSKRSEVLFVDYIAEHLTPGGRAGVIVPDGVITGKGAANKAIRRLLVDRFCLDAVISLPPGVFLPYARAKTSILMFSRRRPSQHVWMAQMAADGFSMDERRRPCEENDMPALLASQDGKAPSERSLLVSIDEVRRRGYDLRIGRYLPLDQVDNSDPSLDVDRALADIKSLPAATSGQLQSHKPWQSSTATVRLGKHLTEVSRPVAVEPNEPYRLLGVKWYGEGPFLRETVLGSAVSATTLFRVREGDIIYNRLFAWKGSFGVIPPELDGCFVSNEFPTFTIRQGTDVSPSFLKYFLKCPTLWGVAERLSTGTSSTSRNRLSEVDFLDTPFPDLNKREQEAYVAGILELDNILQRTRAVEELSRAVLTKWITEFGAWVVHGWRNPPASENGHASEDDDE